MKIIRVLLPLETLKKISKLNTLIVDGCFTPWFVFAVPDSPDTDKAILGVRLDRILIRRLKAMAAAEGVTVTDLIRRFVTDGTAHIILTSKDYAKITEEVRKAEEKRNDNRRQN